MRAALRGVPRRYKPEEVAVMDPTLAMSVLEKGVKRAWGDKPMPEVGEMRTVPAVTLTRTSLTSPHRRGVHPRAWSRTLPDGGAR